MGHLNSTQRTRARRLRRDATPTETMLWAMLRNRGVGGFKFRRQVPIGPFVADFCCLRVKLVVEIDGTTHHGREAADRKRSGYLWSKGYAVIRFKDEDVYGREDWVLEKIEEKCKALARQRG
ncbi:MAG: DUF559 domain-containing protein [Planctomycetota bacterium]|nr:DUF559 domain-containing protein [Planctomycetota bacterium]